jgi:hypothetical protein
LKRRNVFWLQRGPLKFNASTNLLGSELPKGVNSASE